MCRLMTWQPLILSVDLFEYQKSKNNQEKAKIQSIGGYALIAKLSQT